MISLNTSLASSLRSSAFESRIADDTAFRASGNTADGSADRVDERTKRRRCRRCASSAADKPANVERRDDRQNWPIAGLLPLALLVSEPYARRSCAVVSFPSAEFCIYRTSQPQRERSVVWRHTSRRHRT